MQSVDAKTASVAMTRCGNAFRAYLPAQEIAEGKALLKVEGNGFAAFDYTHPGKTSLAAVRSANCWLRPLSPIPNCSQLLRRIAGRDALYPRFESLRRVG